MIIILQNVNTLEVRTVRHAAMLLDGITVYPCDVDALAEFSSLLQNGAMPVGSVEFVRTAMNYASIVEPENITYPSGCEEFLKRRIKKTTIGKAQLGSFIKPVQTKLFTGFIYDVNNSAESHTMEQLNIIAQLDSETPIWESEPVTFTSEFRYYVDYYNIVGSARYDSNNNDAEPCLSDVKACIEKLDIAHPYALDFGVLETGETALVEVNDAWAIGLYGKSLSPREYLYFLRNRWRTLHTVV